MLSDSELQAIQKLVSGRYGPQVSYCSKYYSAITPLLTTIDELKAQLANFSKDEHPITQ